MGPRRSEAPRPFAVATGVAQLPATADPGRQGRTPTCDLLPRILMAPTTRVRCDLAGTSRGTGSRPCWARNPGSASWTRSLLRVRSTCSASAATMGGSTPSTGRDTCFLNIVCRHRPPSLTSDRRGTISHHGNSLRFSTSRTGPEGTPCQGHDRNKCTLQPLETDRSIGSDIFARSGRAASRSASGPDGKEVPSAPQASSAPGT
jgi:hypothetical protein